LVDYLKLSERLEDIYQIKTVMDGKGLKQSPICSETVLSGDAGTGRLEEGYCKGSN